MGRGLVGTLPASLLPARGDYRCAPPILRAVLKQAHGKKIDSCSRQAGDANAGVRRHRTPRLRAAVRVVLFETGDQAWPIATHGGTLFVVIYRGRLYGLTCRHVFKSFDWGQLIVSNLKDCGTHQADPRSIAYPSNPTGDAVDTDMLDIAVLQFGAEIGPGFFRDTGYIIEPPYR
jgi:hypothetical protein